MLKIKLLKNIFSALEILIFINLVNCQVEMGIYLWYNFVYFITILGIILIKQLDTL